MASPGSCATCWRHTAADRIAGTNRRAVAAVPMADIAAWHIGKILDAPDMMPAFD
jgi:hypothetical protein